jgi:hypothetical protein
MKPYDGISWKSLKAPPRFDVADDLVRSLAKKVEASCRTGTEVRLICDGVALVRYAVNPDTGKVEQTLIPDKSCRSCVESVSH